MRVRYELLFVLIVLVTGCSNSHLVYVHEAIVGLSVTPANVESGTAKFSFGYDRETYALVPRTGPDEDAMSLTAVSRVYAEGVRKLQFGHVVATGKAAEAIATDPDALEKAKQNLKRTSEIRLEDDHKGEASGGTK
jgi:hypothetical protein